MRVIDSSALVKFFSKEGVGEGRRGDLRGCCDAGPGDQGGRQRAVEEGGGEMGEGVAIRIISDLLKREAMVVVGQDEYLLEAFRIATRRKVTVYDALFIALAKSMKAELVTSDGRQYEASLEEG